MSEECYIAVDLDGTLAVYDGWKGPLHIGEPIPLMIEQVKSWIYQGIKVVILTARASHDDDAGSVRKEIEKWCLEHIGKVLEVRSSKSYGMIAFFDDRAYNVEFNTGKISKDFRGLPEWAPLRLAKEK